MNEPLHFARDPLRSYLNEQGKKSKIHFLMERALSPCLQPMYILWEYRHLQLAIMLLGVNHNVFLATGTVMLYFTKYPVVNKSRIAPILTLFTDKPVLYTTQQPNQLNSTIPGQNMSFLGKERTFKTEENTAFTETYTDAAQKCEFKATFEENLQYIKSYSLDDALPYMEKLQLYSDPIPSHLSHAQLQGIVFVFLLTGCILPWMHSFLSRNFFDKHSLKLSTICLADTNLMRLA